MGQRFNLSSLGTRMISAFILIPVVLVILFTGGWPFVTLLGCLAVLSLYEWVRTAWLCAVPQRYILSAAGILYICASFICCYYIFERLGFYWAMAFLFMVWGSDTGAYLFGKTFGGSKMVERISPNKTWSGMAGALLVPALCGFVSVFLYSGVNDFDFLLGLNVSVIGFLLGIAGQAGDLLVSFLKRQAGVKDTGDLIPGHGGILDRIDSMLLAAPVFLLLMHPV